LRITQDEVLGALESKTKARCIAEPKPSYATPGSAVVSHISQKISQIRACVLAKEDLSG
jgi:hypothetical protein